MQCFSFASRNELGECTKPTEEKEKLKKRESENFAK